MSKLSKVQVLLAALLIFSSVGSYANAASEASDHKATNTNSGWCYTSEGWVPCPE